MSQPLQPLPPSDPVHAEITELGGPPSPLTDFRVSPHAHVCSGEELGTSSLGMLGQAGRGGLARGLH